jgi:PAS domain S-box-containing protein
MVYINKKATKREKKTHFGKTHRAKKSSFKLRHNEYDLFFNLSLDMLCVIGFDGYFKKVNQSFISMLGYSEDELIASTFSDFIVAEESQLNSNQPAFGSEENFPAFFENRCICKDGTLKWLSWKLVTIPNKAYIYAIAQDITKVKEAELYSKKQTENLENLILQKNESLQYARLLQEALFHDPKTLNFIFPDSFIFHLPKDILSGDFYWFEKADNKVYVACVDCTGHGVPGAMLSVLGINKLHEIKLSLGLPPSIILDKLNTIIYNALGKRYSEKKMIDGMDMAFYSIDLETYILEYAGAHNSLLIIRNNEMIELKGDKQSIGENIISKSFTNISFQLQKNDMVYVYTDGYTDQFGGSKGKKFTSKQLKNLLALNAHETIEIQKKRLHQALDEWMIGYEQTDDICLIAVKI